MVVRHLAEMEFSSEGEEGEANSEAIHAFLAKKKQDILRSPP